MTYLVRKIKRAKWLSRAELRSDEEISSDALTKNLQTTGSKLSLWTYSSEDLRELDEIALAIASTRDFLDSLEIAWVEKEELEDKGISFEEAPGDTPLADLRERHIHAVCLDVVRIANISEFYADAVRNKNRWKRFSVREIEKLIIQAWKDKRLIHEDLKPELMQKIKDRIEET